jgi:hypothetical protein
MIQIILGICFIVLGLVNVSLGIISELKSDKDLLISKIIETEKSIVNVLARDHGVPEIK